MTGFFIKKMEHKYFKLLSEKYDGNNLLFQLFYFRINYIHKLKQIFLN